MTCQRSLKVYHHFDPRNERAEMKIGESNDASP